MGQLIWWLNRPSKHVLYRESLRKQTVARGSVPADVWPSAGHLNIAVRIQEILGDVCWGQSLAFHPDDPWSIIGEWETGDLSEVEALITIEQEFGVKLPADMKTRIENGLTFGELVALIESKT